MALPSNINVVRVRGYWIDAATGGGVNQTITFIPKWNVVTDLSAYAYVRPAPITVTPNPTNGYFYADLIASNSPALYPGNMTINLPPNILDWVVQFGPVDQDADVDDHNVAEPPNSVPILFDVPYDSPIVDVGGADGVPNGTMKQAAWLVNLAQLAPNLPANVYYTASQTDAQITYRLTQWELTPTASITANYTAHAREQVMCATSSGSFTVTLPQQPPDKTVVRVNHYNQFGDRTVTVVPGTNDFIDAGPGGDVANNSVVLAWAGQVTTLQYDGSNSTWYEQSNAVPNATLRPTATITAASYTAKPYDLVITDCTSNNVVVTLPTAPPPGTKIGVKCQGFLPGNYTQIVPGGSDVFLSDPTQGSTNNSLLIRNSNEYAELQYSKARAAWIEIAHVAEDVKLTPTPTKTANYNASVGDLVVVNAASNDVTVTLPTNPWHGARVGVKMISNSLPFKGIIAPGGGDVIDDAPLTTGNITLPVSFQARTLQYDRSRLAWFTVAEVIADTQLNSTGLKTANYSAAAQDLVLTDPFNATGPITVTLPFQPWHGARVCVKNVSNFSSRPTTIVPSSSDVIDGDGGGGAYTNQVVLATGFESSTLQYDRGRGAWYEIARVSSSPGVLTPTAQSANYTAKAGDLVLADSHVASFTVTLPAAPPDGAQVGVKVVNNAFTGVGTITTVTIAGNGNNIFGDGTFGSVVSSIVIRELGESVTLQYAAADNLWQVVSKVRRDNVLLTTGRKTSNYTAAVNELVLVDPLFAASAFTVTLPTAPTHGVRVGVKSVSWAAGRPVTIVAGGADTISGGDGLLVGSVTFNAMNEYVELQYNRFDGTWETLVRLTPGELQPTPVQTAMYTAKPGDLVLCDSSQLQFSVTDGVTSDGKTVTSATANFISAGDVGSTISGGSIPGATTISSVTNATTVRISAAATATATAVPLTITKSKTDGVLNNTTTVTSATITFSASDVGSSITGTGIPNGTTIASVTNATTAVMSAAATATASGVTITVTRSVSDGVTTDATRLTSASANFSSLDVGASVFGTGIPTGATISSVVSGNAVVLSTGATAAATGVTINWTRQFIVYMPANPNPGDRVGVQVQGDQFFSGGTISPVQFSANGNTFFAGDLRNLINIGEYVEFVFNGNKNQWVQIANVRENSNGLTMTAPQSANVTANAGDLVLADPANAGGSSLVISLPNAPQHGAMVGVKTISWKGSCPCVVVPSGSDLIEGGTGASATNNTVLWGLNEYVQYWYDRFRGHWLTINRVAVLDAMAPTQTQSQTYAPNPFEIVRCDTSAQQRSITDGVTKDGTVVSSATANFNSVDVGSTISGGSIPGSTTISSVTSGQVAVISAAATTAANNVSLTISRQKTDGATTGLRTVTDGVTVQHVSTVTDGAVTSGSNVLTSATASFNSGRDVGATVSGVGIPNGTTISSVTNSTTAVLSANATATNSGLTVTITRPTAFTVTSATANFTSTDIGGTIAGAGIPTGTTITAVTNATTVTISQAATATATGVSLTITPTAAFVVTSATASFNSADVGSSISGGSIPSNTVISSVTNATTVVISKACTATATGVTITISRTVTDGNTKNTFTSATANFTSADLKAALTGTGIAASTTIQAVLNSTTVALNQAQTVATGLTCTITRYFEVTLPTGPNPGTRIGVLMVADQFLADGTISSVTINAGSAIIYGVDVAGTATMVFKGNENYVELLYSGRLGTWEIVSRTRRALTTPLTFPAVVTANYTANVGDLVLADLFAASGSFTVTLPTAPDHGARVAVKVTGFNGTRTLTVAAGGSDKLWAGTNAPGSSVTSITMSSQYEYVEFVYNRFYSAWVAVEQIMPRAATSVTGSKTANYTAVDGDFVLVDTTSSAVTVTLPASPNHNAQVTVKLTARPGTNNVTVSAGSNTIADGAVTLSTVNQSRTLQYNASNGNWYIVNGYL